MSYDSDGSLTPAAEEMSAPTTWHDSTAPTPRGEFKVEFGIELVCYAGKRRKKIADWRDCPPEMWSAVLKQIIELGLQTQLGTKDDGNQSVG